MLYNLQQEGLNLNWKSRFSAPTKPEEAKIRNVMQHKKGYQTYYVIVLECIILHV